MLLNTAVVHEFMTLTSVYTCMYTQHQKNVTTNITLEDCCVTKNNKNNCFDMEM